MAQTPEGALKIAAKKAGLELGEFLERRAAGLKRCTCCKEWKSIALFDADRSRHDGRTASCKTCRRAPDPYSSLRGRVSTFKGRTHSPEARAAMSTAARRRPSQRLGKRHSAETRARISKVVRERAPRGAQCHSYVDGKNAERHGERLTEAYKRWRYDVMLRDLFTCQHCGDARGGNLNAHHIKPFAGFPDLRLDLANGITLCKPCHKAVHAAE
ncbi:MAG: HNH endonuclease [Pseudomonadota bacterium]